MFGALFGPMLALGQAIKLGKAGVSAKKSGERFRKKALQAEQKKARAEQKQAMEKKKVANAFAKQQKQQQSQINKVNKNAQKVNLSFNKPTTPKMNVGNQLNTFKKKQNQAIGKGLSNPVNYEQKIKNIMGVN